MISLSLPPDDERLRGLIKLGYAPREAAFIETAALHSGWFLARQHDSFIGGARGRATAELIAKLLERRHARALPMAGQARLHHLSARPLYRALGAENDRNRRRRSPGAALSRVMALDLVLELTAEDPGLRALAREDDKVALMRGLGVGLDALPTRVYGSGERTTVRRFVDKLPVFVGAEGRPLFGFVPSESRSFERHLAEYRRLYRALESRGGFALIHAAARPVDEERLLALFEKALGPSPARERRRLERLLAQKRFDLLQRRDLDRLRRLRRRGPESESPPGGRLTFRRSEASYAAFGRLA